MNGVPRGNHSSRFLWLFPCASFGLAVLLGLHGASTVADTSWYRLLALGQNHLVLHPFSARVLGPALAAGIAGLVGGGIDRGFLLLGILSLSVFLFVLYRLVDRWQTARSMHDRSTLCTAIFLMPFWVAIFHGYYLPDLLYAAILALLLWAMVRGYLVSGMLLLFPAFLARESTTLVVACLIVACWRRISLRIALVGVAATIAGLLASLHFGSLGAASQEGMRGAAYLVGKVLWSLPRNVTGLSLWTNTLSTCPGPAWAMTLPGWLHAGTIRQIGFCGFSPWGPGRLFLAWFGIFGVAPAIMAVLLPSILPRVLTRKFPWPGEGARASSSHSQPGTAIAYRFCVVYGLISFLLAPALGASIDRLVAYGWPFFLIALPWLFQEHYPAPTVRRGFWILAAHLLSSWTAWLVFSRATTPQPLVVLAVAAVLVLNGVAYLLLRRTRFASLPPRAPAPALAAQAQNIHS